MSYRWRLGFMTIQFAADDKR